MLEVDDLHAFYGKSHILQGVTFRVGDGEIVSLLGRNGAGRTTAIKTIRMMMVSATHILGPKFRLRHDGRFALIALSEPPPPPGVGSTS